LFHEFAYFENMSNVATNIYIYLHIFKQLLNTYYSLLYNAVYHKLVRHVSNPYFVIIIRNLDCKLHKLQINNNGTF
jgi:hypothetical protein